MQARAASQFKTAFLELGGSDPVVVLDSADADMAAEIITRGATENSGRLCCAIERVYHGILDQVTKRTVARMQALGMSMQDIKQGDLAR
ncbi:aldehyde dehydrogenase family protein [Paracoccus versutus]